MECPQTYHFAIMGLIIIFNNLLVMGGFVSPVYLLLSYATSLLV
jgi:hypothetical protein